MTISILSTFRQFFRSKNMTEEHQASKTGIDRLEKLYGLKASLRRQPDSAVYDPEKRDSRREPCFNDAWIDGGSFMPALQATILNHSTKGLLISVNRKASVRNKFTISTGRIQFDVSVAWRKKSLIGARILEVRQIFQDQRHSHGQRKAVSNMVRDARQTLSSQCSRTTMSALFSQFCKGLSSL